VPEAAVPDNGASAAAGANEVAAAIKAAAGAAAGDNYRSDSTEKLARRVFSSR
jgi:hypothetical protein